MSEFLLVEVDDGPEATSAVEGYLLSLGSVVNVTVHGDGCCCQNCPWNGDHG